MPVAVEPSEVLELIEMIRYLKFDVRAVTLSISLMDCAGSSLDEVLARIERKLTSVLPKFTEAVREVVERYEVPIVNKRVSVTPLSVLAEPFSAISEERGREALMEISSTIDAIAERCGIDYVGGLSAYASRGLTRGDRTLISSVADVLSSTKRIFSSVNAAQTGVGLNMDVILEVSKQIKRLGELTPKGVGCTRFGVFVNLPEDVPFLPAAHHGHNMPEMALHVAVSGPGVVEHIVRARCEGKNLTELFNEVKRVAYKITRVGEFVGNEVSRRMGIKLSTVDLSLAPSPVIGDSVADAVEAMGIDDFGSPGSLAALALLSEAVKRAGVMAATNVGGLSGIMLPGSEDLGLTEALKRGSASIWTLIASSSICLTGLDMICIPGETPADVIAGIVADVLSIGMINNKTLGVRIIPVPGTKPGDEVDFGGLMGRTVVLDVCCSGNSSFVRRGGEIPHYRHRW
ncbi:MAG: DUF711 family protein [Desulfurococcaceae archaeon]